MPILPKAPQPQIGGMEMRQVLTLRTNLEGTLDIRVELTDPEKEKVRKAIEYWSKNPHNSITFPFFEIKKSLGIKDENLSNIPIDIRQNGLSEEFVMLTEKEMNELDPENQ